MPSRFCPVTWSIPPALQILVFLPIQQELGWKGLQGPAYLGDPDLQPSLSGAK